MAIPVGARRAGKKRAFGSRPKARTQLGGNRSKRKKGSSKKKATHTYKGR